MKKIVFTKQFLRAEKAVNLNFFERLLFIGMLSHAESGKISASPAYLRSVLFPYDDVSVEAMRTAVENIRKTLGVKTLNENGTEFFLPLEVVLRSKDKNEKTNEEKRKEAKEIKKKGKKKEKNFTRAQNYTPWENPNRYSVHFKNERKYTPEQLKAFITDVDDIDI